MNLPGQGLLKLHCLVLGVLTHVLKFFDLPLTLIDDLVLQISFLFEFAQVVSLLLVVSDNLAE